MLTADEEYRYSRHLILPHVGLRGQQRLKSARVLIVGMGGLGSPVALYLAAAGVGTLGLVDDDCVETSNLQRQIIHNIDTVGTSKVASATAVVKRLNPYVKVEMLNERITPDNALNIIRDYEIVVDGTDNFPTRYLLNDACTMLRIPLVFGSIYQFSGQISVFDVRYGPCYRCLYPLPPPSESTPSCAEGGVLGVLPGIIGTMQGLEVLKLLLQIGKPLYGRLLLLDALDTTFREFKIAKDTDCPLCSEHPSITSLVNYQEFCGSLTEQTASDEWVISAQQLHQQLLQQAPLLVDVRNEWETEDLAGFPGASHFPAHNFTDRMHELNSAQDIVIYCAVGARSWQIVRLLRQSGFTRVRSLHGGLLRYRQQYPQG